MAAVMPTPYGPPVKRQDLTDELFRLLGVRHSLSIVANALLELYPKETDLYLAIDMSIALRMARGTLRTADQQIKHCRGCLAIFDAHPEYAAAQPERREAS